jgi:YHS domain-containing protein
VLIRSLLLLLLLLVLARFVWRLVRGVVQGAMAADQPGQARRGSAAPPAVRMAQDPVCGTYVVPGKALELARGRDTFFFCSEKCRTKYLEAGR